MKHVVLKFVVDFTDKNSVDGLKEMYNSLKGDEKIEYLIRNQLDISKYRHSSFDDLTDNQKIKLSSYITNYYIDDSDIDSSKTTSVRGSLPNDEVRKQLVSYKEMEKNITDRNIKMKKI